MVQIRLLGGVAAVADDGTPLDVGPAKSQALLAALALSAGAAVPVSRLVDLVWGEEPPRTAEKTLQTYVTRLRKSLGASRIERTGMAYRLDLDPLDIDVVRFHRHVSAGELDDALAEWSGPPLAGLDAPGLAASVAALEEEWLGAVEARLTTDVHRDAASSVAELTELTERHPYREGLWAALMTALYRSGRQGDALAAYRRARSHLVEELGVEPGSRLRELESAILGQDEALDAAPRGGSALTAPTGTVTFAFSDIEGSSRLWSHDRAAMAIAVARHDEIVRSLTAEHRGYVFATGGDSFGVAFARARDASAWAVALHQAIDAEPWPPGADVRVRIGVHSGEAEERDGDYFGPAVNVASRVASAGHGGQTLVSLATATLLDGEGTRELGVLRLDGVANDVPVLQLGPGEHPPLRAGARRGNLPRRLGRLLGREAKLDEVTGAMSAHGVVTLVGPGGIGKTSVALAVGRSVEPEYSAGVWLVELSDLASGDDVARAVASTLDVPVGPERGPTEALVTHLADRAAVVLLDNCEHVVDGAAALAESIARDCPRVTVLATSREGLGVADERVVVIGPLEVAGAAVELFAERARAADDGFDLEADLAAVEEICRRLDGVPLAIELAAARVRTLPPVDLVARLDDRLRLLTGGRRRSVERHRTLRATVQWSYDLLSATEQLLYRRLSIFAGSFDLVAAEVVCADDDLPRAGVDALLSDLVERSMVVVESGVTGRRFRLLETMRQFGAELLAETGESDRLAMRHARFVRDEVHRLGALLMSRDEGKGAALLAELWPNVRAAVDVTLAAGDREHTAEIIRPLALQMFVRRGTGELCDWTEHLLELTPADDHEAIAEYLLWAGLHYSMNQDRDRFRALMDRYGAPDELFAEYASLLVFEDEESAALGLGPQVVDEMRRRGEEGFARIAEVFTAAARMSSGDFDGAIGALGELADRLRASGPPSVLSWALFLQGASAVFKGDLPAADRYWDAANRVDVPPRTNSPHETLSARSAARQGRPLEAAGILVAYIDELQEVDNLAGVSMVAIEFVNLMVSLGRLVDAGTIVGHLDATGLLGVEGPGFKLLLTEAVAVVEADPAATAARERAAAEQLDDRGALVVMRDVLSGVLGDQTTATPPVAT